MSRRPVGVNREDIDDSADDDHCALCLEDDVLTDVPVIGEENETVGICDDCLLLLGDDGDAESGGDDGDDDD